MDRQASERFLVLDKGNALAVGCISPLSTFPFLPFGRLRAFGFPPFDRLRAFGFPPFDRLPPSHKAMVGRHGRQAQGRLLITLRQAPLD